MVYSKGDCKAVEFPSAQSVNDYVETVRGGLWVSVVLEFCAV